MLKKFRRTIKNIIIGVFEAAAFILMIGASVTLLNATGTYLILVGLFVGVIGLVIHDVWRV
jgi:hypothetical protein